MSWQLQVLHWVPHIQGNRWWLMLIDGAALGSRMRWTPVEQTPLTQVTKSPKQMCVTCTGQKGGGEGRMQVSSWAARC